MRARLVGVNLRSRVASWQTTPYLRLHAIASRYKLRRFKRQFSPNKIVADEKVGRKITQSNSVEHDPTALLTVLVVEDFEDTRFLMRLELEQRGFRVIEAVNGAEGVRVALEERPDIILMDVGLPLIDGITATKQIRENESMKNTLIVALTAHHESEYRASALAAGCDAYLTKPIDFDWLIDLLNRLLP